MGKNGNYGDYSYRGYIGFIYGLHRDIGKEQENYYLGFTLRPEDL